jgi:CheY-like chemotaxis protein
MEKNQIHILLIEDNVVDVDGIRRAFRKNKIANPIHVVNDGLEGLNVLRGTNDCTQIPKPYMILLDLNLPRMNGIEFLKTLRNDPELHDSIVFVLTTSSSEEDRLSSYNLNIAGYIVKKEVGKNFINLVTMLGWYWKVVEFPPSTRLVLG